MKWLIVKGALIALPLFIVMGLLGNLVGVLTFFIFLRLKKGTFNGFLKFSTFVSFAIGALLFAIMGMFYASFTSLLTTYIAKWLAIIIVIILLFLISRYNFKEVRLLHSKNIRLSTHEFYGDEKYLKHIQFVNENVLLGCMLLFPSFIFFLIFPSLADKISLGLNSYLLSLLI